MPDIDTNTFSSNAIDAAIKIALLFLLIVWCFNIIEPFVMPVLWGIILAVALSPLFRLIKKLLNGRNKLAATVFTLLTLAVLIVPAVLLSSSLIEGSKNIKEKVEAGTLTIPPPSESVKEWPLIGENTYQVWRLASSNLEQTIKTYKEQVKIVGQKLLSGIAGAGGTMLQFILSLIIAGVLLANAESGQKLAHDFAVRVAGSYGEQFASLAGNTLKSVAQGLVGIALFQGLLSAIGLLVMDVPAAGVWVVLIIFLAIVQLPPILVLAPIAAYTFTTHGTTPAVIFTIYAVIVSLSDGFLKPLLLGRGVDIPMLVILLGAIGGMILSGVIGLFVGAVVLSLGYKLFIAWLEMDKPTI
jgi:predicted PurR-regulated permease PerM